ncbi:DUF1471 domain-containing protein [Salmonella enterica]|nr:DUF1471 domain-containing protein [Salmonella enterica subsp. enterica serovar Oranienburg]EHM2587352.1 DUF1471 domain-containing protein [Salmonella enterica subsp. enterica serovar Oranienburg]ELE1143976.1 DUF1471 domain-containing protein [Salmonella enterica]EME5115086.1 DUF1471 domain-containing protein [Salmonella enterica]EME5414889.1 DUF1471 domain-containing protein [Salmonella enterica]
MKLLIASVSILISVGVSAADQVSLKEVEHFNLQYLGNISVSATNESVTSPSDLQMKLSELADKKGGKYYHIIAARQHGPDFDAVAEVFK